MRRPNADLAAIGVSLVCIVHCLCLPALLTLVPALAGLIGQDIEHSTVHWTLLAIAVPISTWTLVRSLSRHGGGWLLATGLAALALLFLAPALTARDRGPAPCGVDTPARHSRTPPVTGCQLGGDELPVRQVQQVGHAPDRVFLKR